MDEELLGILNNGGGIARTPVPNVNVAPEPQEQELTPEMREKVTVVNKARGNKGRLQGVTNFLQNPEAQNALLQFGRAFSQNNPNEAGTILADAGGEIIRGNAESAALKAFEKGEDIAEAAGRFARPELVADLQARAEERRVRAERLGLDERQFIQRQEEFAQQINLAERQQELDELNASNDVLLRQAALNADAEQFEARLEIMKEEQDVNERVGEARANFYDAQAEAFQEGGNQENFALRTNEYLEILGNQQSNLQEQARMIKSQLDNLRGVEFKGIDPKTGRPQIEADNTFGDYFRSSEGVKERVSNDPAVREATQLAKEYTRIQNQINAVQSEENLLRTIQSSRLSGQASPNADTAEDAIENDTPQPVGTPEAPMQVESLEEANTLPAGSVVTLFGEKYRINADGTKTPISE